MMWEFPSEQDTIFLTFDDGPTPELTYEILKTLKSFNAKATFFCVGENVQKYPSEYQAITDEEHVTANHTHNHLNGWKTSVEAYVTNVEKCSQMIKSNLFRPPYGRISRAQNKALRNNYMVIMWSVLSGDFDPGVSAEQCLENVLRHTTKGSVVVFHDRIKSAEKVKYALPRFLEEFSKKGFRFKGIKNNIPYSHQSEPRH